MWHVHVCPAHTTSTWVQITWYTKSLANFFEPDFVVKRIEEDAPRILKSLRYPFIPAKSAFLYVARTNWPTLLGLLLYLMDLIKYINCIDPDMFFQSVVVEKPYEYA
ncbi:hypothetical protein AVEN_77225-1, partial [Araneus ventricosus]